MKLKLRYKNKEDIPEGFDTLYTEQGGEWVLTGVEGMKTEADITRLQNALQKERSDHKALKDRLSHLGGEDVNMEEVLAKLDEFDELKAKVEAGGGKLDENKINELVEAQVKRRMAPVERERDQLKSKLGETEAQVGQLKGSLNRTTIETRLRELAVGEKVVGSALEDVLFIGSNIFEVAEDGEIVTKAGVRNVPEGITPDVWLSDMRDKRSHWWPTSQGGGAGGNKGGGGQGVNPWAADHWDIDAQGQMLRADRAKAERMAAAAGSRIGATAPTKVA